jgi:hypothetical protein
MRFGSFAAAIAVPLAILACTDAATSPSDRPSSSAIATVSAVAATTQVFGPERLVRSSGAPVAVTRTLAPGALTNVDGPFTLHLLNGPPGTSRTSSAIVTIDGIQVVAVADLSQKVATLERVVGLTAGSEIVVELRGAPGSAIELSIAGVAKPESPPTRVAQISIQKVTVAGNPGAPVDFNNVKGQIDVTLNLNPGDQTVTKVEVLIDGAVACSQNLSVSESQQLSLAAAFPEDVEAVDILCSINTAEFVQATGVVKYVNGAHNLTARATIGGTTPGNVATPSQALTFNNVSGFIAAIANTATNAGGPASANNTTNGKKWISGNVTLTLTGVNYAGGGATCSNINVSFLGKTTNVTPAAGTQVFTVNYLNSGTAATNIVGYSNTVAAEQIPLVNSSTLSNGNSGGTNVLNLPGSANAALAPIDSSRVDNLAPGAPTFMANPNFRQHGWLNAVVQLNTANAGSTPNGWFVDGTADAGVGGYVRVVRIAANTGGLVDAARAVDGATAATLPAPSAANNSYCAIITARDLLGNETSRPANGTLCANPPAASGAFASTHMGFGVDIAPPTIDFSGGLGADSRNSAADLAAAGQFQVTVSDTGAIGNSGMLSGSAVVGTVILRGVSVSAAASCVVGSFAVATGCSPASVNAAPAFPLVPTTYAAGVTGTNGYYTYSAVSHDAAGNQSALVTRVALLDDSAPVVSTASFPLPFNIATPGIQAQTSDDLDVQKYQWSFGYGAAMGGLPIETPSVAVNGYNAATFINSNVPLTFNSALMGQIHELGTAWTAPGPANVLLGMTSEVTDQGNNATATTSPVIVNAAANPFTKANGTGWALTSSAGATLSDGNPTPPALAANATNTTLRADATGASGTFNPNLTRVDFYAVNAAGTRWVLIGSDNSPDVTDNGAVRQLRYTLSWTPGTAFGLGAKNVRAVAVSGTAGYSTADVAITITNP